MLKTSHKELVKFTLLVDNRSRQQLGCAYRIYPSMNNYTESILDLTGMESIPVELPAK